MSDIPLTAGSPDLSFEQLKLLQAAFRGDVVPKDSAEDFQVLASEEYGASYALLELAKELGRNLRKGSHLKI